MKHKWFSVAMVCFYWIGFVALIVWGLVSMLPELAEWFSVWVHPVTLCLVFIPAALLLFLTHPQAGVQVISKGLRKDFFYKLKQEIPESFETEPLCQWIGKKSDLFLAFIPFLNLTLLWHAMSETTQTKIYRRKWNRAKAKKQQSKQETGIGVPLW